jgi:hypothetical protein
MKVRYTNQQDDRDQMNGCIVSDSARLIELLDAAQRTAPLFIRLSGENNFEIMVGIGRSLGCVQYSRSDGKAPFLMAVSARPPMTCGYLEFLTADTPTPIAARYIVSFDEVKTIAKEFLDTGRMSNAVSWQELDPRAMEEDANRNHHCR